MEKRLIVDEVIGGSIAVSSEKAQLVFNELKSNIEKNIFTIIDFTGIKSLTTAFLNVAIGELYSLSSSDELNKVVKIDTNTLSPLQFRKIKLVMDNSKEKHSTTFKKRIEEVSIHGEVD